MELLKNKNMSKLNPENIQSIKQIKGCLQSSEIKLGDFFVLVFVWHSLKTKLKFYSTKMSLLNILNKLKLIQKYFAIKFVFVK